MARMLRAHGSRRKYHNEMVGYNSRLDALQAAFLRVKLKHVDAFNARRREVAARYNDLLQGVPGLVLPPLTEGHVFHQYTVRIPVGRDQVAEELASKGIGTMVYYPVPLHRLPVYGYPEGTFPEAERASREVLSLPMGPFLGPQNEHVASLLREILA